MLWGGGGGLWGRWGVGGCVLHHLLFHLTDVLYMFECRCMCWGALVAMRPPRASHSEAEIRATLTATAATLGDTPAGILAGRVLTEIMTR